MSKPSFRTPQLGYGHGNLRRKGPEEAHAVRLARAGRRERRASGSGAARRSVRRGAGRPSRAAPADPSDAALADPSGGPQTDSTGVEASP